MKNLIVTTAMVIFLLIVMGWQMELGGTLHQKQKLQYAAEEAAASVAMNGIQEEMAAKEKAEESLRLQLGADGGLSWPDGPVSAEVAFDRRGAGIPAVVVTVKQGKTAASGWYPMLQEASE